MKIRAERFGRLIAIVTGVWLANPYGTAHGSTPRAMGLPSVRAAAGPVELRPHFDYFGGKVMEHLAVVQVLWGDGDYAPEVERKETPSVARFYESALAGSYVDWLREYGTPSQSIGHGRFVGQFRITPSTDARDLDDTQVAAELAAQSPRSIYLHRMTTPTTPCSFRLGSPFTAGRSSRARPCAGGTTRLRAQ